MGLGIHGILKKNLRDRNIFDRILRQAGVSELADETDSKSVGRKGVWVRVPPPAPFIFEKCCFQHFFFLFKMMIFHHIFLL